MNPDDQLVTLRCPFCNHRTLCDRLQLGQRLRDMGMLKRDSSPDWKFLLALLESAAENMGCTECLKTGLIVSVLDTGDDEEWGQARKCLGCNKPIAAERVEIFPDIEFCPECQVKDERGEAVGSDVDYCSHCGDILTVSRAPGAGVARYIVRCPSCGKR